MPVVYLEGRPGGSPLPSLSHMFMDITGLVRLEALLPCQSWGKEVFNERTDAESGLDRQALCYVLLLRRTDGVSGKMLMPSALSEQSFFHSLTSETL